MGSKHANADPSLLRLLTLGPFALVAAGRPVAVPVRKAQALLLLLSRRLGGEISREGVTGLLWSDSSEQQARTSLRQALFVLRRELGEARKAILSHGDTLQLVGDLVSTDVAEFEVLASKEDTDSLFEAAALYRGDFAEGLPAITPEFDHWVEAERAHLRARASTLLLRLCDAQAATGDLEGSIATAHRLIALDPLQEHVHRRIMQAYLRLKRYDVALRQFETLSTVLDRQLGVSPQPETLTLVRQIRQERSGRITVVEPEQLRTSSSAASSHARPAIAVLPFANRSSDPEQDFFAEGVTEDLIAALALIPELLVVSRSASFARRDRTEPRNQIAHELAVRYILEGSVRLSGDRMRVTAQLLDTLSGKQIWADHYDGVQSDVFTFQDEITRQIADTLQVQIAHGEQARLWHGQTQDLRAWKKFVEARARHLRWNEADNRLAQTLLREAIEIDPGYTAAMVLLGLSLWQDARAYASVNAEDALAKAQDLGERVLTINPAMGSAYQLLGAVANLRDQHDEAVLLCRRGRDLAPGDSWSQAFFGMICDYADDPKIALASLRAAARLSPYPPSWHVYHLALASLWAGDFEVAIEKAEQYCEIEPDDPYGYANLAVVYAFQGREVDAALVVAELSGRFPLFSVAEILRSEHYKDPRKLNRIAAVLRKAGLPG